MNSSQLRRVVLLLLVGVGGLAVAGDRLQEPKKDSFQLDVWTIRATTKNADISPELKDLAEMLKKQFKYTGFKLEKKASGKADRNQTWSVELIEAYTAKVTPKGRDKNKVQLNVEILQKDKSKLNSTYTAEAEKFLAIGGYALSGGDSLLVALRAK